MNTPRRNARGEVSLQRILDATLQLVGRYGYDNTTIARITKVTQLPASSIYWYFETKDDLVAAALESFYARFPRSRRSWDEFDRARPVLGQLLNEMKPEMHASESEEPLRLGILLALEGDASQPKIQEPFHRRRAAVLARVEAWWASAFAAVAGDSHEDHVSGTWWMATLTLAYLDGHYISDVSVDHQAVARRGQIVARSLAGAFEELSGNHEFAPRPPAESRERDSGPIQADSAGPEALLPATRYLVAKHGYEGATIRRICTAAGVQRSSAYWRYKDKDGLVRAAVSEPFLALFAPIRELSKDAEDWSTTLAQAVGATVRAALAEPDTVRAGLQLRVRRWDEPTSSGAAVLGGVGSTEADLAAWFDTVLSTPGSEAVGDVMAWAVGRLTEGLMLVSALGRPVPGDSIDRLVRAMFINVLEHQAAGE